MKGKSLREVALKGATSASESKKELSPEQVDEAWLGELKIRFDALSQLHKGIEWADVEKSLKADPDSMRKLQALDEKGHEMNVFGEENGEFIFASAWQNSEQVAPDHKNIDYDAEGQKMAEKENRKSNGNALSIMAKIMGVKEEEASNYLADPKFHEQLRGIVTLDDAAWLKPDAVTRRNGNAFIGHRGGITLNRVYNHRARDSFRAALRVKKV